MVPTLSDSIHRLAGRLMTREFDAWPTRENGHKHFKLVSLLKRPLGMSYMQLQVGV